MWLWYTYHTERADLSICRVRSEQDNNCGIPTTRQERKLSTENARNNYNIISNMCSGDIYVLNRYSKTFDRMTNRGMFNLYEHLDFLGEFDFIYEYIKRQLEIQNNINCISKGDFYMTNFKKEDELVVVVHNNDLFENRQLVFQGVTQSKLLVNAIMKNINENYTVMRRGSTKETNTPVYRNAELNYDFKQPIPYVVIKRGEEYFAYERLEKAGESRLHSKLSIGWGGHQNPLNDSLSTDFSGVVMTNLNRELEEELSIQSSERNLKFIGLINDDENEVGRVHIGILALLELSEDAEVEVLETDQLRGFWVTKEDLTDVAFYERLESWSKFTVDAL